MEKLHEVDSKLAKGREKNKKIEDVINRSLSLIIEKDFSGYILTGTRNVNHLAQNVAIFNKLVNKYEKTFDVASKQS